MSAPSAKNSESKLQIRGSLLLLSGKILALFLNLLTQVLTVRYLVKADYGAFAFAVSAVELVSCFSMLGLNKSCARFVAIYHERHDYERTLGTLAMLVATVLGASIACVMAVVAGQQLLLDYVVSDQLSLTLLLILIALAPLDAIDFVLEAFFGAFGNVRVVFFRRHILGPLLKLSAVVVVLLLHGRVELLAGCYLAAGLLGFSFYIPALIRLIRHEGLWDYARRGRLRYPVGEVTRFSVPLLGSHLVFLCQGAVVVLLLEMWSGSAEVAEYRAVFPFARLCSVVSIAFSLLFTPMAARLLMRGQGSQISQLYWSSVTWTTLLAFPLFALTSVYSTPLSVFMLGREYADAGSVMAVLAVGFFLETTLGLSGQTLRVYARVRLVVLADLIATVCGLTLMIWLIPRYGAWGAGLANGAFMITEQLLYMVFTHMATDVRTFSRDGIVVFASTVLGIAGLFVLQHFLQWGLIASAVPVALVTVGLLIAHRRRLAIGSVYPGIARIPWIGPWLAAEPTSPSDVGGGLR
jgi:O-antigen/teichoic acid export membrane protein